MKKRGSVVVLIVQKQYFSECASLQWKKPNCKGVVLRFDPTGVSLCVFVCNQVLLGLQHATVGDKSAASHPTSTC